jgi:hypothetical protein
MSLLELSVSVDNLCQIFFPVRERKLLADGSKKALLSREIKPERDHDDYYLLSPISVSEFQGLLHQVCLQATQGGVSKFSNV